MILHQPRLDARPFLIGVQFDYLVHVFGKIEHQGLAHGLAGEAGAAAPGEDGDVVFLVDSKCFLHVGIRFRQHEAHGFYLVHARIGAVYLSREGIETHFAFYSCVQISFKCSSNYHQILH